MLPLTLVVEYLRSHDVPFRLISEPSPEPAPAVAPPLYPHPREVLLVDTHIIVVDDRAGIGCVPRGEQINLPGLRAELGVNLVHEGGLDELPWPFERAGWPVPPLGGILGLPVFVDAAVANAALIAFAAFTPFDFIEMAYDDFARLEKPRVAQLAAAGELPAPLPH